MENKIPLNLYKKLLNVRKSVPYLQKNAQGHQYQYASSSQVLGALRGSLDEQGLLIIPNIVSKEVTITPVESKDRYGNQKITNTYFTELDLEFHWVDVDSGETLVVPFYGQGVDVAGEKGVGKALTYAEKYFLLKQFNIPVDGDDPDAFQGNVNNMIPRFISQEQVDELNGYVAQLAGIRNVPSQAIITALGIQNVEGVVQDNYFGIRGMLIGWIENGKAELQNQQNQQNQPQGNDLTQQQGENNGNGQEQQSQQNELLNDNFQLVDFNVQDGKNNNLIGRLKVTNSNNQQMELIVKDDVEINKIDEFIVSGVQGSFNVTYFIQDGFNIVENLVIVLQDDNNANNANNANNVNNGNNTPPQQPTEQPENNNGNQNNNQNNNGNQSNNNGNQFVIKSVERGITPGGIAFAKFDVIGNDGNRISLFANDENIVKQTNGLLVEDQVSFTVQSMNGFNYITGVN